MIRGIFSSAAGMISQYKRIDVLGNNIANVNTPGFKDNDLAFTTFGEEIVSRMADDKNVGNLQYVTLNGETTDFSSGTFKQTGLSSDIAINGNGFFAVQGAGGVKYTRDGEFSVDAQGFLALPTGERLLGANGTPLQVGTDKFSVAMDGTVTTATGNVGKIDVYMPRNATAQNIVKRNDGFFNINGAVQANGSFRQGWLEDSNTDIVGNMTEMMESTRAFQGCQQAFQVSNDALEKTVTQIGSIK